MIFLSSTKNVWKTDAASAAEITTFFDQHRPSPRRGRKRWWILTKKTGKHSQKRIFCCFPVIWRRHHKFNVDATLLQDRAGAGWCVSKTYKSAQQDLFFCMDPCGSLRIWQRQYKTACFAIKCTAFILAVAVGTVAETYKITQPDRFFCRNHCGITII